LHKHKLFGGFNYELARLLTLAVLSFIFSNLALAQLDKPEDKPLIANPNPALADVNCLYVTISTYPRFYWPIDPNILTEGQLERKIESVLRDSGIGSCSDINSLMVAGAKKQFGSLSNLRIRQADFPAIRLDIDMLPLADSNQFVFRVQVSLSKKLSLGRNSAYHVMADVWKHEPVMRSTASVNLANDVTEAVLEQTRAFVAARTEAKQSDVNQISPQYAKSSIEFKTKSVKQQNIESNYVASKNSEVFHKPDCPSAARISAENRVTYETRDEAIAAGKRPCKRCNP